ncbi:MAG: ATP-binding protein [Candidatus Bathyarchaeota archaeon]
MTKTVTGKGVFKAQNFIDQQLTEIRRALGKERAVIACSGGVDSTTCAVLTRRAVGENLVCVFIDTNFMRLEEPEKVFKMLSEPPLELPVRLLSAKNRFMKALRGLEDAEKKRKAFRDIFYSILCEAAKEENCHFLVQGTILPDILETVKGIKTQHNVLDQMKIDTRKAYGFKLIEPLVSLYKSQVREVARCLAIPLEASERQPFPGPGLSVRVVGKITPAKLDIEKAATKIVEERLEKLQPKQFFPAIIDSNKVEYPKAEKMEKALKSLLRGKEVSVDIHTLQTRATGILAGHRLYGKIVAVSVQDLDKRCLELPLKTFESIRKKITDEDKEVSRVLYRLIDQEKRGKWIIAIRAVETLDFVQAAVSDVPWSLLKEIAEQIENSYDAVSAVYYDITSKPPASIEFE